MLITLQPVVELPTADAASHLLLSYPNGSDLDLPDEWFAHNQRIRKLSGFSNLAEYPKGSSFIPVQDLSDSDILRLIELHCADLAITESCAFFGGYVLAVDRNVTLIPQCCGTLADIASYKALAQHPEQATYLCPEGHPCPSVVATTKSIKIICENKFESFRAPAKTIELPYNLLSSAIEDCVQAVEQFAQRIDQLTHGELPASQSLIYELA